MAGLKINLFKGRIPILSSHLLPKESAQEAENCDLQHGDLRPYKGNTVVNTPTKIGTKKTIYLFNDSFWFHWLTDVDVALGPIAGDTEIRTYFTGDGVPKMTYTPIATSGGGTDYPNNTYTLGIPAPTAAGTASVGGVADNPVDIPETRSYVYTWVSGKGEEGPVSPASNPVEVRPGQYVDLSGLSTGETGNYDLSTKRVYRLNTGSQAADYQFVAEIPAASSVFSDGLDSSALGEVLKTADWVPPPSDMAGLIQLPNETLAGFSKNELCLCEPRVPHAWPTEYRYTVGDQIVAIASYGTNIVIATEGIPYLASGMHPSSYSLKKIETLQHACVSKRGMVSLGNIVLYPSTTGLIGIGKGFTGIVTENLFSDQGWKALKPESMEAYRLDDRYVCFYDTGAVQKGFILDPKNHDLVDINFYATAGYNDPKTGDLYLQVGDDIVKWNSGSDLTFNWKSKKFRASTAINFGIGEIYADSYPVHLKCWAGGVLKFDADIASGDPFRLPAGFRSTEWEFELSGTNIVKHLKVAETSEELSVMD